VEGLFLAKALERNRLAGSKRGASGATAGRGGDRARVTPGRSLTSEGPPPKARRCLFKERLIYEQSAVRTVREQQEKAIVPLIAPTAEN
jgi:hypothetical protein